MDADNSGVWILELAVNLVRRRRLQRAADMGLFALLPAAFMTALATVFRLNAWLTASGVLLIFLVAITLGLVQPLNRRQLLLSIDRRLHLKESLITATEAAATGEPLNEMQAAQLEKTVRQLEGYPLALLLPWSPPALLPLAPILLILLGLILPLLPSLPGQPDPAAVVQAEELVRRLAARSRETGDTRYRELSDLLREVIPAVPGNGERARPGEEAPPVDPEGLERLPPLEGRSNGEFRFDEDLEALFRLEPRRSGEGYALSRSLAEDLGLTPDELAQLEAEIGKLDRSGERTAEKSDNSGNEEGTAGNTAGDNRGSSATGGDGSGGETGKDDKQQPGGDNRPGGGSGTEEGRRNDESYTPGDTQLGSLEKLEGEIRGDEQLRGALRYLSPEGRSLIEQEAGGIEYRGLRQSPRSNRESRPEYEEYIGEYFRLLHGIEAEKEESE